MSFDLSKYKVNKSDEAFDLEKYKVNAEPQEQPSDDLVTQIGRNAMQATIGGIKGKLYSGPAGAPLAIAEIALPGAISEAQRDLLESDAEQQALFKKYGIPDAPPPINPELLQKGAEEADQAVLGKQGIVGGIATAPFRAAGVDISRRNELEKAFHTLGLGAAAFSGKSPQQAISAGLYTEAYKELMQAFGVEENVAELLALAFAGKTSELRPSGPKTTKSATSEQSPPGAKPAPPNRSGPAEPPPPPSPGPPPPPLDALPITPGQTLPRNNRTSALEGSSKIFAPKVKKDGFGIDVEISQPSGREIQGRVIESPSEKQVSSLITKEGFKNDYEGGNQLSEIIKENAEKDRELYRAAYKKAEKVYANSNDIYPQLTHEVDSLIAKQEKIQRRNQGEEAVYQQALALRELLGTTNNYIEQSAGRLIAQSNSMSQLADYDFPYRGQRDVLKYLSKQVNNSVIDSLKRKGLNYKLLIDADKQYAEFATKYLNKRTAPFLNRNVRNPEALLRKSVSDEGTYRAVRDALGPKNRRVQNKIDALVVTKRMEKYNRFPDKIGTQEYQRDIENLRALVGDNHASEIDRFLLNKKRVHDRNISLSRKTAMPKKVGAPTLERVVNRQFKTDSDVAKALKTPQGIRDLKREFKAKGEVSRFNEIAREEAVRLFKENKFGSKKLTGKDIVHVIDKHHGVLSEIMGETALTNLYNIAEENANAVLTLEKLTPLLKKVAKYAIKYAVDGAVLRSIITSLL